MPSQTLGSKADRTGQSPPEEPMKLKAAGKQAQEKALPKQCLYANSADPPYIPSPEGRGFTAGLIRQGVFISNAARGQICTCRHAWYIAAYALAALYSRF